ncbi:MerR family transcriptional regulator [Kitasatospora sp. MMS16-BH015]|uniref:MerR family transcriptional regulator n=1 Tax=Kitasatospora sp. MMS16-BH015 TaxID=2018025 RepID=UPI000CA17CAF|nr:MerR family transcriptional regulator [Kitasatospora sp. MMS16-BH015]AUG80558.1 MerR family transcriptional regulator [Kitasatospora sp. MMS16-BH015]
MDRTNLLPIGQFAQASGLPITALRHYDTSGVLTPALVDPGTGYRYYRRDQLRAAQLVRSLRQLDIPIEEVRELLGRRAAGESIAAVLLSRLAAAERRLAAQRALVHHLLHRDDEGDEMGHRIELHHRRPVFALACRATVDQSGLDAAARASHQAMYTFAGQGPLTFAGPAFSRLHGPVTEEHASLVEFCLPIAATAAKPGELPEGIELLELPAATYVSTVVEGEAAAFPTILGAYDAVAAWISEHSFGFAGPVEEIYLHWGGEPGHPDNRLEIAWPVTGAEAD